MQSPGRLFSGVFLIFSGIFLTLLIAALTGCGGGNNANPTTQTSPSTAGTTVQVGMGDSPAD